MVANIVNFVNNNIVGGGKLYVTVVNVFGSWLGDFVAPGQNKSLAQAPTESTKNDSQTPTPAIGGANFLYNPKTQETQTTVVDPTPTPTKVVTQTNTLTDDNSYLLGAGTQTQTTSGGTDLSAVLGEQYHKNSSSDLAFSYTPSRTQSKNVLHINLAWLLLAIPCVILLGIAYKIRSMLLKRSNLPSAISA